MFAADLHLKRSVTTQSITEDIIYHVVSFLLSDFKEQRSAVFRVKGLASKDMINNDGC